MRVPTVPIFGLVDPKYVRTSSDNVIDVGKGRKTGGLTWIDDVVVQRFFIFFIQLIKRWCHA